MDYPAEATFYVRLSLMHPKPGQEERVSQIMDDLLSFLANQPGYVRGFKLSGEPHDPQGRVGRLIVWSSEADANRAATTQHDLSVRSELMRLIEEDSHVERSYTAIDPQLAKTSSS